MNILFICHGNICRSTMAHYVMEDLVARAGLSEHYTIDSAATSRDEIGNTTHPGTRRVLAREGIPCGNHRARQLTRKDYDNFDLIIGMDRENKNSIYRILLGESPFGWYGSALDEKQIKQADPDDKVHLLLDWTSTPRDIADPWYTGDFDTTYRDVREGCEALLAALENHS